jgi:NADPH:quinone reductase-like Zn-dependent oxidoreductase
MKAIIWTKYGSPDGLQLKEVPKPVPNKDELLIKVHATSVTAGDIEMRKLRLPMMLSFPIRLYAGLLKPKRIKILGQEFAGEVEAVGENVDAYKTGDRIFGTTGFSFGAYAEYICLHAVPNEMQGALACKPENLTYAEAAVVPTAGFEALHFLRRANVTRGQKVLVFGAGGSIGTFSVQLAKQFGAEVTGVDSAGKSDMLKSIGADIVIDYAEEDFTENGVTYDVIIDVVGKKSFSRRLKSLKPNGYYFLAFAGLSHIIIGKLTSLTSNKKVVLGSAKQSKENLLFLKELIETGQLKPVIDRCYPLEQVAEAHRYVETGNKKGNVCIMQNPEPVST